MKIRKRLAIIMVMGVLIPFIILSITIQFYYNENMDPDYMKNYKFFLKENEIESKIAYIINKIEKDYSINPSRVYGLTYFEDIERDFLNVPLYITVESELLGTMYDNNSKLNIPNEKVYKYGNVDLVAMDYQKFIFSKAEIETLADDVLTIYFSTSFDIKSKTRQNTDYKYILIVTVILVSSYILIYISVYRSINKPLNRLQLITDRFLRGYHSVRVNKYSKDELGELSRTIDKIFDEIEDNSNLEEHFIEVPLNYFIEDIIKEWKKEFSVKNTTITLEYNNNELYSVKIDIAKINMAVKNILSYIYHYSSSGEHMIEVILSKSRAFYCLQFSIKVIESDKEVSPCQLNTFYPLEDVFNSHIDDMDSGLIIAKKIIDYHNGKILLPKKSDEVMAILIQLPLEKDI